MTDLNKAPFVASGLTNMQHVHVKTAYGLSTFDSSRLVQWLSSLDPVCPISGDDIMWSLWNTTREGRSMLEALELHSTSLVRIVK